MTTARTPQFFPTQRYRDPQAAIAFLEAAFGFTAHYVARAGEGMAIPSFTPR